MCGIFAIAVRHERAMPRERLQLLLRRLFLLSESRGKESSGLHAFLPAARRDFTLKAGWPAGELLRSQDYRSMMESAMAAWAPGEPLVVIAHSRLVTNGPAERPENNQPVRWGDVTMVHNGIVVNVDRLWQERPHLRRAAEVDTEVMAAMASDAMGRAADPVQATRGVFAEIRGAASVAWVHDALAGLVLATNTGDLYMHELAGGDGAVFASEQYILRSALRAAGLAADASGQREVRPVEPGTGVVLDLAAGGAACRFPLDPARGAVHGAAMPQRTGAGAPMSHRVVMRGAPAAAPAVRAADESLLRYDESAVRSMRRCARCVLPETFPFIAFDGAGVCNYCRSYRPKYLGVDAAQARARFEEVLRRYRSADGSPDVLVPFSGGRDSCYGLHLLKRELGMSPITFTYDWGMVTDLARRNIARLCGRLGVQNILVSADIRGKRDNIRRNVAAWLRRPDLGLVPLFMAGDKHFFKIVNDLKRQTGIRLDIWSANPLENTDFKSGFCGVAPDFGKKRIDELTLGRQLRMALHYAAGFAVNPAYLNRSLIDTARSFVSYYMEPRRDFYFLYNELVWNEDEVNRTIIQEYDFERSPDSPSTWRIGDGTAPFYNYIYMTARGFTEFDTFRSNQIREGQITRDAALQHVVQENRPRAEGLRWYLETIGLDFNDTVRRINQLHAREPRR
jgi:hypothetical protein